MSKKQKLQRLLELADAIETEEAPAPLDMRTWGYVEDGCVTAACAGGNYVLMFPDSGLRLEPRDFIHVDERVIVDRDGRTDFDALEAHFDFMSAADVYNMFTSLRPDGAPAEVAARIRVAVAKYQEAT